MSKLLRSALVLLLLSLAPLSSVQAVSTSTVEDLLKRLRDLQVQIASLQNTDTQSPTAGAVNLIRTLTLGSRGEDVRSLQEFLVAEGFLDSEPTGYFGPLTYAAIKEYQISIGLEPVGNVGPKTLLALQGEGNASKSPELMSTLPVLSNEPPLMVAGRAVLDTAAFMPTESEMLRAIAGTLLAISDTAVTIRTEWPTSEGIRIIERTIQIYPGTVVTFHGEPKDPELFRAELAEYDRNRVAGMTGLTAPFPNKQRTGNLSELKLGTHVAVRPVDPAAVPLIAADITVPLPPMVPMQMLPVSP